MMKVGDLFIQFDNSNSSSSSSSSSSSIVVVAAIINKVTRRCMVHLSTR